MSALIARATFIVSVAITTNSHIASSFYIVGANQLQGHWPLRINKQIFYSPKKIIHLVVVN